MSGNLKKSQAWRTSWSSFQWQPVHAFRTLLLLIAVMVLAAWNLNSGTNAFGFDKIVAVLWNPDDGFVSQIIWEVRLPRLLTAVFAGAALGVSGAVFQSISRNPLGSPDIIGFTTGAASGAIFYLIFLGESSIGVAISAMIGGISTAIVMYFLSIKFGTIGSYRLVLIGIGVGATLAALNGLMLVKGDLNSAITANIWLAGSLNARQWEHVLPLAAGVLVLLPLIWVFGHQLSLIEIGDELASQLGVKVQRVRLALTFYAVALSSLATAAAGPIAFIALAAPQLAMRVTQKRGLVIFGSALMGALLLVAADLLSLTLPFEMAFPIGLVTAFIGGLYLLWLVTRVN